MTSGLLALIGGGEFSFGETLDVDRVWLARAPEGPIGFIPAASGSQDYAENFAAYLEEAFEREGETIPIYRGRDGRRGRNAERIAACAAVYLGGGVVDHLLEALLDSPALVALSEKRLGKTGSSGVVALIGASAQAAGQVVRSIFGGKLIPGFGWLEGCAIEPNFDPGHDRRLRKMFESPLVTWGLGIPAGSAVLVDPQGKLTIVGTVFRVSSADGDLEVLTEEGAPAGD